MKRSYIPWLCVTASGLALAACVDGGATIQILRNQVPEEGCVVPNGSTGEFLSRGRIDSTAAEGYLFTPLVENRGVQSDMAERVVFVEGANIDLKFDDLFSVAEVKAFNDSPLALSRFRQAFSGSIGAGASASFGFEVIPKAMLEEIDAKLVATGRTSTQVIAEVEVTGTLDGGGVGSNIFSYPIQVCKGCLTNNLGSCDTIDESAVRIGGACQVAQDGILDCCTDAEGALVCPAQKPADPV